MTEQTAIRWDLGQDGIVTLTMDDPNQSANTMNELYQESMKRTVARLQGEVKSGAVKGVILTSAKKTFFAGGDLKMLSEAQPENAADMFAHVREITGQLRALETDRKSVV